MFSEALASNSPYKWAAAVAAESENGDLPRSPRLPPTANMGSLIANFLQSLTPPPFVNTPEYDGWEYRWKLFVFRPAREYIFPVTRRVLTTWFTSAEKRNVAAAYCCSCVYGIRPVGQAPQL